MPGIVSTTRDPDPFTDATPTRSQEPPPDPIRIKNRRKRYLDLHPTYFDAHLELADPLLYDRLIRRFQTPAEREAEGRSKGYSGILEADLWRSEAKLDALRHPDPNSVFTYKRGPNGEILEEEKDEVPATKEEGLARWKWEMECRFLRGGDVDFDYKGEVDHNEAYDDIVSEERDAQDRYFDGETPEFVSRTRTGSGNDDDVGDEEGGKKQLKLEGETGIQDF